MLKSCHCSPQLCIYQVRQKGCPNLASSSPKQSCLSHWFLEPQSIDQDQAGLERRADYSCPEYDMDFVGNDIAYAAGTTSWQACGESSIYCIQYYRCFCNKSTKSSQYSGQQSSRQKTWLKHFKIVVPKLGLEAPQISRRPMQVHCGEMQVLDLGEGGRHVPAQGLGLWLPEQEWNSLWGSLLSQGARVGCLLSSSDPSNLTLYLIHIFSHELYPWFILQCFVSLFSLH